MKYLVDIFDKLFATFDCFHNVTMKSGVGCPQKVTDREKRLMELQDDTCSLTDLV